MKNRVAIAFAGLLALSAAGCTTSEQNGTFFGGATGAAIGGIATHSLGGALVGGAIGAGAGYALSDHRCNRYDRHHHLYSGWCHG